MKIVKNMIFFSFRKIFVNNLNWFLNWSKWFSFAQSKKKVHWKNKDDNNIMIISFHRKIHSSLLPLLWQYHEYVATATTHGRSVGGVDPFFLFALPLCCCFHPLIKIESGGGVAIYVLDVIRKRTGWRRGVVVTRVTLNLIYCTLHVENTLSPAPSNYYLQFVIRKIFDHIFLYR